MIRNIIITESQVHTIYEKLIQEGDSMLRGAFNNAISEFEENITKDPINGELPQVLKDAGIEKKTLIDKMLKLGMMDKEEGFDELNDGFNQKYSQHKLKYIIHNKNYEANMDKLYDSIMGLNECDCGSCMGGGALGGSNLMVGSSDESGGITYPMGGKKNVMRRGGYNSQRKTGDVTKQKTDTVDMSDALSRDTKHGISMNRQK